MPDTKDGVWAGTLASRPRSGPRANTTTRAPAGTSGAPPTAAEVARLESAVRRRELALERLLEATLQLRRGHRALHAENRELRVELERLRRRHG